MYNIGHIVPGEGEQDGNMSGFVQIKRSTFRKGVILLYAVFLSLIAYTFLPQILTPKPGEKSLRCAASQLYVGLARAAGQTCTTKCTNWEAADCSGFSSCYNKNISCINGIDQNGRPCKGCCYDCVVVCEPDPDLPPSILGSISCGQWGNNGWCTSSAKLNLNVSDPQGYTLSITGDAQGTSISCNGNCSVDLPVGSGGASYVVTASQSGLSASGSTSWNFDPIPPVVGVDVNGSAGQNGWYRSPVTVTPTGTDSVSGLAGAFVSVNNGAWQSSATLNDGVYTIAIAAADNAGNIANSSSTVSIDTVAPSISVSVNGKKSKSGWFATDVTVSATISDATSGIASVEVRMDGGAYQSYSSPLTFTEGQHSVQFRVMDKAGNLTETSLQNILIDLHAPLANLSIADPGNGVIGYKLHDGESGLDSVSMTIKDKDGVYPKVSWDEKVSGKSINDEFSWDGKLEGETDIHPGDYIVWVKVVDQAGNQNTQTANITVSETGFLSLTPQEGKIQGNTLTFLDLEEENNLPDQSTIFDQTYGGSSDNDSVVVDDSLSLSISAVSGANPPPFPWALVAVATTAVAGAATYIETKPKKSDEQKKETRRRLLAELEAKWDAQARIAEAVRGSAITKKADRLEVEEEIRQHVEKAAKTQLIAEEKQRKLEEKKVAQEMAGMAALYNARKQGEQESVETNWWEETKSFVNENVIQPVNTAVIQPYVKPFIEETKTVVTNGLTWANEVIYKPYIAPEIAKAKQTISDEIKQFNEEYYQPYIKPVVEKAIDSGMKAISEINKEIIQPYVQPVLLTAYGALQPYIEPFLETSKETLDAFTSVVNEVIYQPFIQPALNFLEENIYDPIFKPVVDDVKDFWSQYGETIHGALDAVGFIPGLGDMADAVNGLLYFGEGRYLEAGIAAIAMIPMLGDLGKAGKLGLKFGEEVVEEVAEKTIKVVAEEGFEKAAKVSIGEGLEKTVLVTAEEGLEKTAKETAEATIEKTAKASAEETAEKVAKETTENIAEKAATEATGEVLEKTTRNAVENASSKVLTDTVENTAENTVKKTADNLLEKAAKNTGDVITSASTEKAVKEAKEKLVEQALEKVDDKTAALVRSVADKVGDDAVSIKKAIALIQKHGDDAVKALRAVDADAATKVLRTVDDNILDDVIQQGDDAFAAFSSWTEKELKEHGKDLAARATKDAEVLNDVKTLISKGPIDPKNLTDEQKLLIEKIAANSTFIADGNKVVVGKWVGLDGGFLKRAKEAGALHYSPHPDLWGLFKGLENQNEAAWLINQKVIQNGVGKGLTFEYTLDGILSKDIVNERAAIKAIFSDQTEEIIKKKLKSDYLPVRMRELQELKNAGFELTFDEMNNSYTLIKP